MTKSSTSFNSDRVLYEDNHLIIVNKLPGELVQGDQTGDQTLADKVKDFIKERDKKPGNVFLGIPHRLDRPVSGIVIYTKTSKGLSRMSDLFRRKAIEKIYWAVVENPPVKAQDRLTGWMIKNERQNKSYVRADEQPDHKFAALSYTLLAQSDHYALLEVALETGRHHQIRVQLSNAGAIIKGDLKYGAKRSNADAGIHLHARSVAFVHPIKQEDVSVSAPCPPDNLWQYFEETQV